METTIYYEDRPVGTLEMEEAGLYWKCRGTLPDPGPLVRLYLVGEDQTLLLGTALPGPGSQLTCHRTVARKSWSGPVVGAVALASAMDWRSWREGLVRLDPEGATVAVAYTETEPVPGVEHYPDWVPLDIDGRTYLTRRLSLGAFLTELSRVPAKAAESL